MESPGAERPRRRLKRILVGTLLVLVATVVLLLATGVVLLHHLDQPWLKQRIVSQVEAASGLRVDYQAARVAVLSGLRLEGLVVRTPPPFEAAAPELLRVGTLEAHWSPGDLLSRTPRVERVVARDVVFTQVADEAGPTSLVAVTGPEAPEPTPLEAPLGASRQAADFLSSAPPFGRIELSGVSLGYVRVLNGAVVDRWSLRGLAAVVEAKRHDGEWKLFAELGQPGSPLPLVLGREAPTVPPAQAALELALSAEVGASAARARVDLDVARQSFDPRFTVRALLHGAVSAKFDGEQQHITVNLDRTRLTDSAEVQAQLVLPDAAELPPILNRALADVDLGRLLQALPPDLRPITLERGKVHLDAQDVTLSAMPQLGAQGRLGLEVEVAALQHAQDSLRLSLGGGRISLTATPDPQQGLTAQLAFALQGLDVRSPSALRIPKASGELKGHQLRPDPASPLQVAGDVALSGMVEALEVRASGLQVMAKRLGLQLRAPLAGKPPFTLKADMPVELLQVVTAEGRELLKGPVTVKLHASEVFPGWEEPQLSRARARLEIDAGTLHASLDATKGSDDLAYTLDVQTPDLVVARPFLPDDVAAHLPWKQLGVAVASKGKLTALFSASPRVEHRTELRLQRPGWDDVTARDATFVLSSHGDSWRHQGELDLQVEGLRIGDSDAGPQHQRLTVDMDRRKPSLRLGLTSQAGLKVAVDAALAFDRKTRGLRVDVKGDLPPLGPLSPLLVRARVPKELEPSKLALSGEVHGTVFGLFTGIATDGTPRLAPNPPRTIAFDGTVVADGKGMRWKQEGLSINLPEAHWKAESHVDGSQRSLHSHLTAEKLSVTLSDRRLSLAGVSSETTVAFTDKLEAAEIEGRHEVKVRTLEQKPALPYPLPVQDLEASFTVRHQPHGVIHVPDLKLSNPGTGTELNIQGRLDLSDGRRRLAFRGALEQDLSRIAQPGRIESSGKVSVDFRVASPDLVSFRTLSHLVFQNVNLRMPESGVAIETLDGSVPLAENVQFSEGQARLMNDSDVNPYSMLRFADQHPLMSGSSFVSVGRITTPMLTIAPLAGNLSIHQNVVSMSQLEMGVRGGRITGQCLLDWQGKHSTLEAHVRATGVKSSRGEPFDGNAAVVISARERSVNGRAEILRIGNRHLLDLLDLEDPRHVDPATNRVRYALGLGYPEHVRVSFNHGFGSLRITMGGLASLISIDEIRGIPMGPLVDRMLLSLTPPEATP
ncbi:hypothetical protein OV208_25525 [Corallococcus sp. bb12-1]|nr:hypothetical protein [Corallococcus sp. bb12-1]